MFGPFSVQGVGGPGKVLGPSRVSGPPRIEAQQLSS